MIFFVVLLVPHHTPNHSRPICTSKQNGEHFGDDTWNLFSGVILIIIFEYSQNKVNYINGTNCSILLEPISLSNTSNWWKTDQSQTPNHKIYFKICLICSKQATQMHHQDAGSYGINNIREIGPCFSYIHKTDHKWWKYVCAHSEWISQTFAISLTIKYIRYKHIVFFILLHID